MADPKPMRRIKQVETVRQQAEKAAASLASERPRKVHKLRETAAKASAPLGIISKFASHEYHPIKLPDNKAGRFLSRRARIVPRFFVEAWQELRQVTWPSRKETIKLTLAVLVFALIFGGLIAIVDYGLDKLFRNVILG